MDSFSEVSAEIDAKVNGLAAVDEKLAYKLKDESAARVYADTSIVDSSNAALEVLDGNIGNLFTFVEDTAPYMAGFNELPDGVATEFTTEINRSQIVFLNGLMQLEDVDYTFDYPKSGGGTVTFASAPAATDKLNIYGITVYPLGLDYVDPVTADGNGDGFVVPGLYSGTLIFDTEVSTGSTITALAYDAENNLISGTKELGNVAVQTNVDENDPTNLYSVDLSFTTVAQVAKFEVLVGGVVYGEITSIKAAISGVNQMEGGAATKRAY
jgi:hypothetical protein